eukprot:5418652-Prymnesium_polylepis.1
MPPATRPPCALAVQPRRPSPQRGAVRERFVAGGVHQAEGGGGVEGVDVGRAVAELLELVHQVAEQRVAERRRRLVLGELIDEPRGRRHVQSAAHPVELGRLAERQQPGQHGARQACLLQVGDERSERVRLEHRQTHDALRARGHLRGRKNILASGGVLIGVARRVRWGAVHAGTGTRRGRARMACRRGGTLGLRAQEGGLRACFASSWRSAAYSPHSPAAPRGKPQTASLS